MIPCSRYRSQDFLLKRFYRRNVLLYQKQYSLEQRMEITNDFIETEASFPFILGVHKYINLSELYINKSSNILNVSYPPVMVGQWLLNSRIIKPTKIAMQPIYV